jgi:hypothetical protein
MHRSHSVPRRFNRSMTQLEFTQIQIKFLGRRINTTQFSHSLDALGGQSQLDGPIQGFGKESLGLQIHILYRLVANMRKGDYSMGSVGSFSQQVTFASAHGQIATCILLRSLETEISRIRTIGGGPCCGARIMSWRKTHTTINTYYQDPTDICKIESKRTTLRVFTNQTLRAKKARSHCTLQLTAGAVWRANTGV